MGSPHNRSDGVPLCTLIDCEKCAAILNIARSSHFVPNESLVMFADEVTLGAPPAHMPDCVFGHCRGFRLNDHLYIVRVKDAPVQFVKQTFKPTCTENSIFYRLSCNNSASRGTACSLSIAQSAC